MKLALAFTLVLTTTLSAQKPPTPTPPTGHVVTPDVTLAYWVFGTPKSTTPVFAINGGPGLSHVYMLQNDVWQRIAKTRQVVFYDQRVDGASPLTNLAAAQTMAAQVADLDAIREHLHFAQVDLVGDSYGGGIAMAYTAAHPEHVRRLILSDSVAPTYKALVHLLPQVFPDVMQNQPKPTDPQHPTAADADAGMRFHFSMIFYSPENRDRYLANAKDLGVFPATGAAVFAANRDLDMTDALPKFKCPTLVINGRYDMNVAPLTAWNMAKAIPGAKFVAFEKSGHLPSYEEPDRYVQVVEEFLDVK